LMLHAQTVEFQTQNDEYNDLSFTAADSYQKLTVFRSITT